MEAYESVVVACTAVPLVWPTSIDATRNELTRRAQPSALGVIVQKRTSVTVRLTCAMAIVLLLIKQQAVDSSWWVFVLV
jgi:hypothetical protein